MIKNFTGPEDLSLRFGRPEQIYVITNCPLTQHLRMQLDIQINSLAELFRIPQENLYKVALYWAQILKTLR